MLLVLALAATAAPATAAAAASAGLASAARGPRREGAPLTGSAAALRLSREELDARVQQSLQPPLPGGPTGLRYRGGQAGGFSPSSAAGLSSFGLALFALACDNTAEPVVFLSPLSVAGALALAAAGASPGASESELLSALGVEAHTQIPELSSALLSQPSGVELNVANSIWTKKSILPEFIKVANKAHHARAAPLPKTYAPLNAWVSKQTQGRITDILHGDPSPDLQAILINAIFFKGSWAAKFQPKHTTIGSFHAPSGDVAAPFMRRTDKLPCVMGVPSLGGASVVQLDYGEVGGPFSALLFLPADATAAAMAAVTSGLRAAPLADLLLELRKSSREVELLLPRFKAEWGVTSLVPHLRALGVAAAFEGGSFSRMSNDPGLHIDDVLHKATIEVNEEGTVAAAATAVGVCYSAPLVLPMHFDRPFVMLVVHRPSALPLFAGRFNHPKFG